MSIVIQKAIQDDRDKIAEFQLLMALETEQIHLDKQIVERGVQAVFEDISRGCYYMAKQDEKTIASLLITYEWSDWRNGWVWWIQSVYVIPEFRNRKIFKKMYAFLQESVLKHPNARGLRLYVDNRNVNACKVYEALGMDGNHYHLYEWIKNE